jgi:cell division septal protein FtsQ
VTAVRLPWSRGTRVAKRRRRTGRIGRVIRRIRALPRALKILLAVLLVVLPLLAGGWLWFRDSQFVAVQQVTITGLSADAPDAVRSALTAAAREQTTLNFDLSAVRAAVAGYPLVADVRATTDFPHGAAIAVTERRPVAVAVSGKSQVPVAPDGLLLRGLRTHGLPPIAVDSPLEDRGKAGRSTFATGPTWCSAPPATCGRSGPPR